MGHRVVKRVPMDFGWPLNKVWEGYFLPEFLRERDCTACDGGYSPEAESGAAMAIAAGEIIEWRERADRAERAARELAEAATELQRAWDSGGGMHGPMGRLAAALAMNPEYSKESGT